MVFGIDQNPSHGTRPVSNPPERCALCDFAVRLFLFLFHQHQLGIPHAIRLFAGLDVVHNRPFF
jgi:hypothetical protein